MIEFKFMIIWLLNLIIENKFYKKKNSRSYGYIYVNIFFTFHIVFFNIFTQAS